MAEYTAFNVKMTPVDQQKKATEFGPLLARHAAEGLLVELAKIFGHVADVTIVEVQRGDEKEAGK